MSDALSLDHLNTAPPDELRPVLRACVTSSAWADRFLAGRPYARVDDAVAAAEKAVLALDAAQIDAALAGHPRIGERPGGAHADGAAFSRSEQSGVDSGADTAARLAAGNAAYEQRFGHVFLIRAAGRDADQILAELERRLGNDPATERAEAAGQLAEITALRMRQVLA
ncbi:Uricase [Pseudonocardia sp. Ae406_Ps2]|uniref:2-oxo-4-hydroxy-4-carboxy-5-ureidoimidazoline decarboxylase n=1 Tax=unclassified Pseudonocardia TaxID=2619320 RepID=UPI00094B42CF|nr:MULTISPECIES: 2-oxo-4-hydroxy-4-carboxy-5-ureidoimidazoline decarboxylase [unclassified Pseudonocardia]OLM01095.1 Uricase [Pseudonocardia sp. Ae406_Ps2]OLM07110.1 Uricase [Pseudonocardia sp. Ae331_Ps2]OLM14304.1 Uricase [Pseudonocardia sp. Ae505_Ps2]OLM22673.1 Uricase [Pseudonocardia sp. Ae706_Ps2]OLM31464.1 Uricase [Pseudonocardia sp. Ae717_Ps2]